jgi:hypothetical protein
MNRAIGIAMLVVGTALVIYGISAAESFGSDVSRFFTGNPTDRSMWLLLGGLAALIVGGFLAFRGDRRQLPRS